MALLLLASFAVIAAAAADPAGDQLPIYKMTHSCPMRLTNSDGCPIYVSDTTALNSDLLTNKFFMDFMPSLVRGRIPERIVHAKGAGAFGYFEVTDNVTDICMAELFSGIGKKTPVVVRFSETSLDKGEADTNRDPRGFSVKFYTREGNFDFVGFNSPMFLAKDPNVFLTIAKVVKRNPVTNLRDPKMLWDFVTLRPETIFFIMYLFGDNGIPDGYRYMPGFSIHTYQVYNKWGQSYFVRWHMLPNAGVKNLSVEKANELLASDPDYAVRDIYNAIALGNYPYWTLYAQVLSLEDVKKAKFDVFDITQIIPEDKYPLRRVGKLVLNKNPVNYFAEVEQTAFCPANVVPGILGAPDNVFLSRRFSYRDAQMYRLGSNFNKIIVNTPHSSVHTYNRDGRAPVIDNGGSAPNYYPNSYHGPMPEDKYNPKLIKVKQDESVSYDQATDMYNQMTKEERKRLIANIVSSLKYADNYVQKKAIELFSIVHIGLGSGIAQALAESSA